MHKVGYSWNEYNEMHGQQYIKVWRQLYILIIKPTRCTNFSNLLFGIKFYMFQTIFLSIIRSFFFTAHTAMVYVIHVCWQFAVNGICHTGLLAVSCRQTCITYTIAACTVKNAWWWTEELSETRGVLFQK